MENKELSRIRELLEFLVKKEISKELEDLSKKEKDIYFLTGEVGQVEIRKRLKVSADTVSNTWKKLEEKGLLKRAGKSYEKVI